MSTKDLPIYDGNPASFPEDPFVGQLVVYTGLVREDRPEMSEWHDYRQMCTFYCQWNGKEWIITSAVPSM